MPPSSVECGFVEVGFNELHIKEVVVHPEHQKKGMGKKLMTSIEETALKNFSKKITLSTLSDTFIHRFYKNHGYVDDRKNVLMEKIN